MAKYQVIIEVITSLSREVEANSAQEAEQLADEMYRQYQQGQNTHIVAAHHHRSVELLEIQTPRRRWQPAGK